MKELAPPPWSLRKIAEEVASYPVLFLLSPGADPGSELQALASNQIASATGFTEVSLGQGQVAQAELALESACRYLELDSLTDTLFLGSSFIDNSRTETAAGFFSATST